MSVLARSSGSSSLVRIRLRDTITPAVPGAGRSHARPGPRPPLSIPSPALPLPGSVPGPAQLCTGLPPALHLPGPALLKLPPALAQAPDRRELFPACAHSDHPCLALLSSHTHTPGAFIQHLLCAWHHPALRRTQWGQGGPGGGCCKQFAEECQHLCMTVGAGKGWGGASLAGAGLSYACPCSRS